MAEWHRVARYQIIDVQRALLPYTVHYASRATTRH
jgi:hypothetical protein